MLAVETAIQAAVVAALMNDADLNQLIGGRVYDRVPPLPMPKYPYVSIGAIEVSDDANSCSDASSTIVMLHVWSNAVGSVEAKKIGGLIRGILAPGPDASEQLEIQDHVANDSAFDLAVYRPGDDPLLTEGVLQFHFLTDPTE